MSKIISSRVIDFSAKKDAFPYQLEAFLTLKDMEYSAIFHEQGLGKTKIAIDLLLYWLQNKGIDTVMVVTKKQLVKNWQDEFELHTYIKPKVLSNNKKDNFYVLNSPAKVIITNFETFSTDKDRITLFLKSRDVAVIIDESAKLKNPEAKLTRDFFDLAPLFKIRTIMTGTPIANRPYDIWSQIFFLDQGKSLGDNFEVFKQHTDLENDFSKDLVDRQLFEESVSGIFPKISGFSIRETKASCGLQLPQKIYQSVFCNFEVTQESMYYKVMRDLEIEVKNNESSVIDDDSAALKRLLRLNQIASNPRLIDDSYSQLSGKEVELDNLLNKIIKSGDKCIVWSSFIDNIDQFTKKYNCFGARKIHGSMSIDDRNKSVDIFKKNPSCKVLFATPQAAKEGLTLTVANHVVFYDRCFNLDDYLQAQDRIHRISQNKTCYVYNIMIRDSIDEWIDVLIEAKHSAALLAQGDIDKTEYGIRADYSYGDLIKEILNNGGNFSDE